ncbi:MAG: choice-of-anchor D domain-containing protein [Pirellulales bacterium]
MMSFRWIDRTSAERSRPAQRLGRQRRLRFEALETRTLLSVVPFDINAMVAVGKAAVTGTAYDIGNFSNLFDGNVSTLYRSANIDPASIQVAFTSPKTLHAFRACLSHASGNPAYRWKVETADTQADMDTRTGTFAEVVPWTGTPSDLFSTVTLPTPVSARLAKLTVERLTGDNYVHIEEWSIVGETTVTSILVTPATDTLPRYSQTQYHATAVDTDGVRSDCTKQATWSTGDAAVATVDSTGLVRAVGAGQTQVIAALGSVVGSGMLTVQQRQVDLDVTYIERTPRYDYDAAKNNPAPGDLVRFLGHVRNWSDFTPQAEYRWLLDGATVAAGVLENLAPGEERVVEYPWVWQSGDHQIKLVVDPANRIAEASEVNNQVDDRTNAILVGFWVEQSVYDYFQRYQQDLGIGANSWEDWAQRQMAQWNKHSVEAVYPTSPQGVLDRVRIDRIIVVRDGLLPLSGGLAGNHPDTRDKTVDLMWGFPATGLNGTFYADHTSRSEGNPFYLEGSLIHELGHARYLIDDYGYDVANNADVTQVQVLENGQPVAGSAWMPFIAWNSVLYYNQYGGVMTGPWRAWSPYEAAALNLIAGRRASQGNYNAPGNIGAYLNDLPQANHVRFVDAAGQSLAGASVRVYRATAGPGWYGKIIDNTPDLQYTTDADGYAHMPRNPFADVPIVHTYGNANGLAILRIEQAGTVWYRFMEVPAFNMEYWRGHTQDGYYTFELPQPGSLPEIDVLGYEQSIRDGDTTPSLADHTDFGTVEVNGGQRTRQFVVMNRGATTLRFINARVSISGLNASDFTLVNGLGDGIAPGAIATFQVKFSPKAGGVRTAKINIYSSDQNENPYDFVIRGTGATLEAGDANGDGRVDIFDVAVLQTKYGMASGATWADGDFDGNGTVDVFDVALMQVNYGEGVANAPAAAPTAEALDWADPEKLLSAMPIAADDLAEAIAIARVSSPTARAALPTRPGANDRSISWSAVDRRHVRRNGIHAVSRPMQPLAVRHAVENASWESAVDRLLESEEPELAS